MTDYRARAEQYLQEAPHAGSVNHGQVEALTGIGYALLHLADQLTAQQDSASSSEDR